MLRKMTLGISLIAFLSILLIHPSSLTAQSDTTFLYYYSLETEAFIIERPDGSERQILAEYKLPEFHTAVFGPGWSQSGNWFAWTSGDPWGTRPDSSAFMVSRDGTQRFTLLDGLSSILNLQWSPTSDLLLVSRLGETHRREFFVIDANTQTILTTFDIDDFSFTGAEWTPDGLFVVLYGYEENTKRQMTIISPNGHIQERTIYLADTDNCLSLLLASSWSKTGKAIYLQSEGDLVIEDFHTGEKVNISLPNSLIVEAFWSPDQNQAVVFIQTSCAASTYQAWLLDIQVMSFRLLAENVVLPYCSDWEGLPCWVWSSEGNAAIFLLDGTLLTLLQDGQLKQVNIPSEYGYSFSYTPLQWTPDGSQILSLRETPDNKVALFSFDILTHESTALFEMDYIRNFSVASDGQHVALSGFCEKNEMSGCIFDTESRTMIPLISSQDSLGNTSYFYWSPDDNWLIQAEEVLTGSRLLTVSNLNGTIQRDIGFCVVSQSCFGWLPKGN
ncbi:MAG: hypothetical protein DPW16_14040 [Chloroflexi bacterium]|nr:hypothetical protein [Chloroflexota bacterium]